MVARVTKLVLTALLLGACDFDDDFNDGFDDGFDDGFAVHSLCSCGPGALVLPLMLVQTRSVGVAFYARANQERCAMQFRLVQARRNCCRLLGSCGQGTLVLPFMLVQTRSFGVAFYARADQELCAMQFRLVRARRTSYRLLGSCGQEALVSPFMLVRTRSLVPCSLGSCRRGALVSPFMLMRTRSVGVAFYARADQELWCCLLCSCRPGALVRAVLGSCEQGAFVGSSSDLRESFLAIFIARSFDRVFKEVFGQEVAHRDGDGRSMCRNFIIFNTFTLL
ncbi:hypothetical protein ACFX13_020163 [Malus domestica]